jgi:hypothetical protein
MSALTHDYTELVRVDIEVPAFRQLAYLQLFTERSEFYGKYTTHAQV